MVTHTPSAPIMSDSRPVTVEYFTFGRTATVLSSEGSSERLGENVWFLGLTEW